MCFNIRENRLILMVVGLYILFFCLFWYADSTNYKTQACFTPGQQCDEFVVERINHAEESINVQAYHLTNKRIIYALIDAKLRGINVTIILDKAAKKEAQPFLAVAIPVWIDNKPAIAHNKVMIFDHNNFITGSFNFTEAAQHRNAENVLWSNDRSTAKKFEQNFIKRLNLSS